MNYENLISIVMPVFNAQAYLEEALESVRRQTWTVPGSQSQRDEGAKPGRHCSMEAGL